MQHSPKQPHPLLLSCLWLAYNAQWGALLAVALPKQIEMIAGEQKYIANGLIGPAGAWVALITVPLAGALSDRVRGRGRRLPFLISGVLLNCLSLILLSRFGQGSSVLAFAACFMAVQFTCNWWGGPYAALIPDLVSESERGRASGWMALMNALGTIAGAVTAGQLILRPDGLFKIYGFAAGLLFICLLLTVWGVRETPTQKPLEPFRLGKFIKSFWIDPKEHRNFYWTLTSRAVVMLGLYSVLSFFQYFLGDILQSKNPAGDASILVGIITLASVPSAYIGGRLSDRFGRIRLVVVTGAIMAVATSVFSLVPLFPKLGLVYALGVLFGLGYGAYCSVDWALAVDVLPNKEDAAKDMGIWHVAMVLPQIIGPFLTGGMLSLSKSKGSNVAMGYALVFGLAAAWFVLGTVLVRRIRGIR